MTEPDDFLGCDLTSLLLALGEPARASSWLCTEVECFGRRDTELHALSDHKRLVTGSELLEIISGIDNIVDGYFSAFRGDETTRDHALADCQGN